MESVSALHRTANRATLNLACVASEAIDGRVVEQLLEKSARCEQSVPNGDTSEQTEWRGG